MELARNDCPQPIGYEFALYPIVNVHCQWIQADMLLKTTGMPIDKLDKDLRCKSDDDLIYSECK